MREGLEVAVENVRLVAEAGLDPEAEAQLPQGHSVRLREVPVARAAIYVPAGRNPYPSTVVMGAVTARAAGVDEVVVASGDDPAILAACALCEVDAVFRMGGAQAIAALAYGTETRAGGRRDRRARAACGCRRPSARCPATSASTASRARAT